MPARRQVLARYSILKAGALISLTAAFFGWIVLQGMANSWAAPPGATHPGRYLLAYAAAPFGILATTAMLLLLVIRRGVAIQVSRGELILNFPLWRKRVPISSGLEARATLHGRDVSPSFVGLQLMPGSFASPQITFSRPDEPDVNFRSGMLTENAETIAARVAALVVETRNLN